ncbi:MAG: ubiquinol-cytochrome c reductase iron-sulfur subunit [Planctomycetaceae bacterium]
MPDDALSPSDNNTSPDHIDRRSFLNTSSTILMVGGVGASYGTFAYIAGKYLMPSSEGKAWLFVCRATDIVPGGSFSFQSPTGVRVAIKREAVENPSEVPPINEFLALSSICPHLGCRVHWEGQNNRFFCPCHNGVFDPQGKPVSGPPAAAGQELSQYNLQIEEGNLYIEMPVDSVSSTNTSA